VTKDPEQVLGERDEAFYTALLDDDPVELYENAPCGYLSTLSDGTVIKANATFFAWTGFERTQIIGRERFQNLLAPGDRIFYETHYAPLLRMQGSVREIAVSLRLPDGRRLPVLANSVLREDSTGRPEIVRTVLFDARERRAYEEELVAARRRAEESEASARALAQTLQATLLPPLEPSIPGLDVAGAYRPAGDGFTVGGDFFDVFRTGRGSHSVVLGDVSGKGPSAAVVTALVRYTVRAEALHSSSPAQVLRCVHEAMARYQPDRFCTAVLLEVAPTGAGADITVAVAGHEPPILTDGRTSRRVGEHGSILGMLPEVDVSDRPVPLRPGDSLVLYTDGISEARRGDEFFGEERIETLVTELAGKSDAAGIATGLADAAVSFQHGEPNDDIAVVVLKAGA
jgi:phosphoserine phosphatase RsbU/P